MLYTTSINSKTLLQSLACNIAKVMQNNRYN